MLHDDLLHHGESQPGPSRFGREKRHEQLRQYVRRDSRAVIGNAHLLEPRFFAANDCAANNNPPTTSRLPTRSARVSRPLQHPSPHPPLISPRASQSPFPPPPHLP